MAAQARARKRPTTAGEHEPLATRAEARARTPQAAGAPNAGDLAKLVDALFARFYPSAPDARREAAQAVADLLEAAIVLAGAVDAARSTTPDREAAERMAAACDESWSRVQAEALANTAAACDESWSRVQAAAARLAGLHEDRGRVGVVVTVVDWALRVREAMGAPDDSLPAAVLPRLRRRLALADPRFEDQPDAALIAAFEGARSSEVAPKGRDGRTKGGRGVRGPSHVAKILRGLIDGRERGDYVRSAASKARREASARRSTSK